MASVPELEAALEAARAQRDAANLALVDHYAADTLEAYYAAGHAALEAERALADAQGLPYAVPIDFTVEWSKGAPLPHLLLSDRRAFLLFVAEEEPDPARDRTRARVVGPETEVTVAIAEFAECRSAKLGSPNDETIHGHPLGGRGLYAYGAFVVRNSPWIAELARVDSMHRGHDPERWAALHHFLLSFHDSTFECVAESGHVDLRRGTIAGVLKALCERL